MGDKRSRRSANEQVAAELRRMATTLAPGARLPTVRELAGRFAVTQHAIQSAIAALNAEGLVESHVGRGTFVATGTPKVRATKKRRVLTLMHRTEYERGDAIGQLIHDKLIARGHRSLVLTYSDVSDAMTVLKDGPQYDACILQPRTSFIPVRLLGLLKERSSNVLLEMRVVDRLDVDAVSNDPAKCTELILDHLTALGHRRIAWVVEEHEDYFYELTLPLFRAYRHWNGLTEAETPIVMLPKPERMFGFADLAGGISHLFENGPETAPTAVVLLTFDSAARILSAFERLGLRIPEDVSVIRIGTPNLDTDHAQKIATVGRPTEQAAEFVLRRLEWRWENPTAVFSTYYDTPKLEPFSSTAAPRA
ncbi:MAG: substrate-binding domain-containing protein [Hyphomicrobiaceae bacterium]|nr:substrate-binding domain-containing protein [Hyphomicrobiaceae bacterium]